ncbi:transposase [Pandoraea aquatica]|uniref:Transposase n=1 Tax=Pandoraea aquatica TaxID=2508290 RepID=A0A5E4S9Q0_9BURK|nr:DDE-type integrase/transposase/recombinase [Pandoraea aquatica]VVD72586.1 transposase [Pandoraea aquatica]
MKYIDTDALLRMTETLALTHEGRDYVRQSILNEGPSRKVESKVGNVVTKYVNRLTNVSETAESLVEYAATMSYEMSLATDYYASQPPPIHYRQTVHRLMKGRESTYNSPTQYTADFLVVEDGQVFVDEWKTEAELQTLVAKQPYRYQNDSGVWKCPERQDEFGRLGITYRLRANTEISPTLRDNVEYLQTYIASEAAPVPGANLECILTVLKDSALESTTIEQLMSRSCGLEVSASGEQVKVQYFTIDHVHKALVDRQILADWEEDLFGEQHRAIVCLSQKALDALRSSRPARHLVQWQVDFALREGAIFELDSETFEIHTVSPDDVHLVSEGGKALSISRREFARRFGTDIRPVRQDGDSPTESLRHVTVKELNQATNRRLQVNAFRLGKNVGAASRRSLQRWTQLIRLAGTSDVAQIIALLPKVRRGNRTKRYDPAHDELLSKVEADGNTPTNPTGKFSYKQYVTACEKAGLKPLSTKWYYHQSKALKDTTLRLGARRAYQLQAQVLNLERGDSIQGLHPFHVVHIDHTQLDCYVVIRTRHGEKRKIRPWLTVAFDAYSRTVLALYISAHPPNFASVMMVLREMVSRHRRKPDILIVDNGAEFRSDAMHYWCVSFNIHLRFRPAHHPRFGSVLERWFGTSNTECIHNLIGNTKATKHVRTMTKSVNPLNADLLDFPVLHALLDYYAYHVYNTAPHSATHVSPADALAFGYERTGNRPHQQVEYDEDFYLRTCIPFTRGGVRKVESDGVLFYEIPYFHEKLSHAIGMTIPAVYDPWNCGHIYVALGGEWLKCVCKLTAKLEKLSHWELRYVFDAIRVVTKDAKKSGVNNRVITLEIIERFIDAYLDGRLNEIASPSNRNRRSPPPDNNLHEISETPAPENTPLADDALTDTHPPAREEKDDHADVEILEQF